MSRCVWVPRGSHDSETAPSPSWGRAWPGVAARWVAGCAYAGGDPLLRVDLRCGQRCLTRCVSAPGPLAPSRLRRLVVSWRWGPPRLDAGAAVHSVLVAAYVQDLLPAEGDPLDLSDDELDLPPVEFLFGLVEVIGCGHPVDYQASDVSPVIGVHGDVGEEIQHPGEALFEVGAEVGVYRRGDLDRDGQTLQGLDHEPVGGDQLEGDLCEQVVPVGVVHRTSTVELSICGCRPGVSLSVPTPLTIP